MIVAIEWIVTLRLSARLVCVVLSEDRRWRVENFVRGVTLELGLLEPGELLGTP